MFDCSAAQMIFPSRRRIADIGNVAINDKRAVIDLGIPVTMASVFGMLLVVTVLKQRTIALLLYG